MWLEEPTAPSVPFGLKFQVTTVAQAEEEAKMQRKESAASVRLARREHLSFILIGSRFMRFRGEEQVLFVLRLRRRFVIIDSQG